MSQKSYQQDWEELGENDPLWAILSENDKRFGKWNVEDFLQTGVDDIGKLQKRLQKLSLPVEKNRAMDFGCGVGRLSRALGDVFSEVTGVDISRNMIDGAKRLNSDLDHLNFLVNTREDLSLLETGTFDLVYSKLVLQHVSSEETIKNYIREFIRIIKPGGLIVFQLPSNVGWKARINPRRHLYSVLRTLGFSPKTLMEKYRLSPIQMRAIPVSEIRELAESENARIVMKEKSDRKDMNYSSVVYYITRD